MSVPGVDSAGPWAPGSVMAKRPAPSSAGAMERPRARAKIRVGTDFSGLDIVVNVLKDVCLNVQHIFSSDADPKVRKYLAHNHAPKTVYEDVRSRNVADMEPVDLYAFGPPCQSFSSAGRRQGSSDDRGKLFAFSLDYIQFHKPSMVVFENVSKIQQHKDVMVLLTGTLESNGYAVHSKVLNTMSYGCPQHRERFYLVALLGVVLTHHFDFPAEVPSGIPFSTLVPKLPNGQWQHLPISSRKSPETSEKITKIVATEVGKVAEKGINPFVRPVCIDTGNSEKWMHHSVDHAMTLTRTHCQSFSHWCTTKGAFLTVHDYMRLQGLDPCSIDYEGAGLSSRDVAGMLGNCMSGNVLEFLLPRVLHAAGFISDRKIKSFEARTRAKWGSNGTASSS